MHSYEALQSSIAGKTVDHAKALGVGSSLLHKWQEPTVDYSDSGAYNPLDRIKTIVKTSIELGRPRDKALTPVFWLCHEFGLVSFDQPDVSDGTVAQELLISIREFADLAQVTSEGLLDHRIDKNDARRIIIEGEQALRAIGSLVAAAKELY